MTTPTHADALTEFLHQAVALARGQIVPAGESVWQVTGPAKAPDCFGPQPLLVTTDKEAHLLDPSLTLLAPGAPFLHRLVRQVQGRGLTVFKGRYGRRWSDAAIREALAGLLPARSRPRRHEHDEPCLRVLLRARLRRDYAADEVLTVIVDAAGRAWAGGVPLDGDAPLEPLPKLTIDWPTLKRHLGIALATAESALLPTLLDHEADLAEQLRRERARIQDYYAEIEESGEYADGLTEEAAIAAALEALGTEKAKLLDEQHHRYRLEAKLEPLSIALLEVTTTTVTTGGADVLFHPLLGAPVWPACQDCGRQVALAVLRPQPRCRTCQLLLET